MDLALSVKDLIVNHGKVPALWNLNFSVPAGKRVAIVGPNGAGKSSLLQALLGFIPSVGEIAILGAPLKEVYGRLAYVPQREAVDWDFPITVLELVLMGGFARKGIFHWPSSGEKARARAMLARVDMEGFADRQISQLSGGQQQRVFLARMLMQEAEIYFLDEPFAGIDALSGGVIFEILDSLKREGKSLFVIHHDLAEVRRHFDWVILLNMSLVGCGPVEEVFTPEKIERAFGKRLDILQEVAARAKQVSSGWEA